MAKLKEEEPYMQLEEAGGDQVRVIGKKLRCRWIDSYLLVWSDEEHPYDK